MNVDEKFVTKRKANNNNSKLVATKNNDENLIGFATNNIVQQNAQPTVSNVNKKQKKPARRLPMRRRTLSSKANLLFPVTRFKRYLVEDRYATKISPKSCVFLAAVLEYLTAEVLDISAGVATRFKKHRISPRHLNLAIRNDVELDRLIPNITIPEGGIVPNVGVVERTASKRKRNLKKNLPQNQDQNNQNNQNNQNDQNNQNNQNDQNNNNNNNNSNNTEETDEESIVEMELYEIEKTNNENKNLENYDDDTDDKEIDYENNSIKIKDKIINENFMRYI